MIERRPLLLVQSTRKKQGIDHERIKPDSMNNPFIAELIGTMLLIIFGDGVVANVLLNKSKGQNSGWIVIATGWAMAVAVGVYASWPISGAHINPAVTIGLAVIGKFPWAMVVPYIIAQMIGAFLGAVIVWLAYRKIFLSRKMLTSSSLFFARSQPFVITQQTW